MSKSNQAVAPVETTTTLPVVDAIPDFLKGKADRGNENVGDQVEIPRLKLLQKMSGEVDKNSDTYAEGAEPGLFLDKLTGELLETVHVISINFMVEFVVWRKRDFGGGKQGTFPTRQEAEKFVADMGEGVAAQMDIQENHQHLVLVYNENDGKLRSTPFIIDMSSTKLRVSRNWNSQLLTRGGERFSTIWKFAPTPMKNDKGSWVNLKAEYVGFVASEEDYKRAEELYESTKGGTIH